MFKKKLLLVLTLLSMTAGLQARDMYYNSYDPCVVNDCCPNFCCDLGGEFTVYGDYLYWRARRCELDYAIPYDGNNYIGDVNHICPEYDNGFRVGGRYRFGDMDVEGKYTRYYSSSRDSVTDATNTNLAGTRRIDEFGPVSQGSIALAYADWDVHYDGVDALLGYDMNVGNCFDFRLFGGFKYLSIEQNLNVLYSAGTDITNDTNSFIHIHGDLDMDGYGLTFGFETRYTICDCFGIIGSFAYDVLASEFDRREVYLTTTDGGQNNTTRADLHDECWRTISGFNLAVGLSYDMQLCGCYDVFIAAGYEFHHYLNLADFIGFQSESGETTFDRQTDGLGFDGLFVRLGIGF